MPVAAAVHPVVDRLGANSGRLIGIRVVAVLALWLLRRIPTVGIPIRVARFLSRVLPISLWLLRHVDHYGRSLSLHPITVLLNDVAGGALSESPTHETDDPASRGDTRSMLLIVRHGETPPNRHGRLLGRADPWLTETGEEQARQLARWLPVPDRVVSSPLRRARDTAAAFGRPVELDERWIELDYGELDGHESEAVPDDVWARWRADSSFAPAGGESLETLSSRVHAACAELSEVAAASTVVVVTHVSPVKAAIAWALGVPIGIAWRMYVEDASVSRIDIGPDGPVVRWFNRGIVRDE